MLKIDFEIKEIKPKIFVVSVPDRWDLGMLFLRVSEFYENPNLKGQVLSPMELIKYFAAGGSFDYPFTWEGYNVPYSIAVKCYEKVFAFYSEYDFVFYQLMKLIKAKNYDDAYIIGVYREEDIAHEICHAYYKLNDNYKSIATSVIDSIPDNIYKIIANNLKGMGYDAEVIDDEIQAYFMEDTQSPEVIVGLTEAEIQSVKDDFETNLKPLFNSI